MLIYGVNEARQLNPRTNIRLMKKYTAVKLVKPCCLISSKYKLGSVKNR